MSELLSRLDPESQIASTSVQRTEILAKKGSCLAGVGRFEEASHVID